jgi:hypothetical protein
MKLNHYTSIISELCGEYFKSCWSFRIGKTPSVPTRQEARWEQIPRAGGVKHKLGNGRKE